MKTFLLKPIEQKRREKTGWSTGVNQAQGTTNNNVYARHKVVAPENKTFIPSKE